MKEKNKTKSDAALNRRDFIKFGSVGAAVGAVSLVGSSKKNAAKAANEKSKKAVIKEHDSFPNEVSADYQSIPSYSTVHGNCFWGRLLPAIGYKVDEEVIDYGDRFLEHLNYKFQEGKKGMDQLSKAVVAGGWAVSNTGAGPMPAAVSDFGLMSWDQNEDKYPMALMDNNFLQKEKFEFESRQQASDAIKRAARLYGADLVGITKRDKRWDYSKNFNPLPPVARKIVPMGPEQLQQMMELGGENMKIAMDSWTPDKWVHDIDNTAGFVPKTVIVMAFEMDYEAQACASNEISSATCANGYSEMTKAAHQLAVMIRQLGYKALPCGNDTGMSIPYAIAAGLGEGSRMGTLVTYKYGPRVRLAKVYTDLDFVEYDKPKTFGVTEFCTRCKRCADACPSKAIPFEDEPTWEPTHKHKDNAYFHTKGVKKWYLDAKSCMKQWADLGTECANCITSCPYNKPDFWHHRLVDGISAAMPGPVHNVMREMDILFGYGNVDDEKAVDKFFSDKNRSYDGF